MSEEKSKPDFFNSSEGDEIEILLRGISEIYGHSGIKIDPYLILEHIALIINFEKNFKKVTSDPDHFLTISDIEALFHNYQQSLFKVDFKNFLEKMTKLVGEAEVIKNKKLEYLQKGIKLRNFRSYHTSVMTVNGRYEYTRKALIPSTQADGERLLAFKGQKFVFPLDEVLEIDKLPFKISLPAMLMISKVAICSDSYEEAEEILTKRTHIRINDDTIRKVTDTLGEMVYKNDLAKANECFENLMNSQIVFPSTKIPHTLYLEVNGDMLPTREKDELGSVWRENKLGMVFSDDKVFFWNDEHGERRHRILKREFINHLGESDDFKKLMLSLAIRNGYGQYQNTVLISDGATWIQKMKEELFPDAQHILDFYLLCENVLNYAKNVFSLDEAKYKPFTKEICDLIKASKHKIVLDKINKLPSSIINKSSFNLKSYILENMSNIDYADYRKKGYFIGSGEIDSANKYFVQRRLKLSGKRWYVKNAQFLLSLMAKYRSGLWDQDVVEPAYKHYGIKKPSFTPSIII
ncbi:MAG: UPF0236 family protein [Deltaproteobacteria bacterium]|jgi:hypothetical protein|nr:UPF0236 family protein [Deltaproteobacteria bacterium]